MLSFSMKRIRFTIGLCQNNMRQTVIYRIIQSTSNTRSTNSNKKYAAKSNKCTAKDVKSNSQKKD